MNGRDRIFRAMNNKPVDRVPIGFWKHFVTGSDQFNGLKKPQVLEETYREHLNYFEKVKPDMMKIMSEGFFGYPPIMVNPLNDGEDLLKIKSIGAEHEWISKQVEHVKHISKHFKEEAAVFYNIFAPLQVIRIKFDFFDHQHDKFVYLAENFPDELRHAGLEIQKDINTLVQSLFDADAIDGIYYCVQNIQSKCFDREKYKKIITPTEIEVLENANERKDCNILHICGYEHHKNDVSGYNNYRAKIYNWARHTENIELYKGKQIFGGRCVLGGFDNNPNTILDSSSVKDLQAETRNIINENSYAGFILGADCSLPDKFDVNRLLAIKEVL